MTLSLALSILVGSFVGASICAMLVYVFGNLLYRWWGSR